MPDAATFSLFLAAAAVVAVTPGPGIFYVLTRSLKGGRGEGFASTLGNSLGGLVHVAAAALGLSAVLMASATGLRTHRRTATGSATTITVASIAGSTELVSTARFIRPPILRPKCGIWSPVP